MIPATLTIGVRTTDGDLKMADEIARLKTALGEAEARAAYAVLVAELTFSIATMGLPEANKRMFLQKFAEGLKKDASRFPGEEALAARVAGLFADFAARNGVRDAGG